VEPNLQSIELVSPVLEPKYGTKGIVIPGNPVSESGVARPGIQEYWTIMDAGFHRHDDTVYFQSMN
jgi:hypothetical protein